MEDPEETIYSSSDETQLTIAESTKKKKRGKTKQQIDFEEIDRTDRTIESTIGKFKNLTSEAARKILCKLVKNDHLLALSLLKAEEGEDESRGQSESSELLSGDETDKRSDNEASVTPKLTRLKAKQLNKQLPIPGSLLDTHEPDEEVVKLIQEELKSDDEDEEYQPEDSDGDITNTTFSDVDSQPSTPGSALVNNEELDSPLKSGDFKIPRTPLTAEEQENVSRRTRSKLCLQTTSIETIESTFIPPDFEYDLYDFDRDFENEDESEWKDFLSKYNLPIAFAEDDKYDEADPEYIASESVPIDKEELRSVRVPKKELSDLITELFEDSNTFFREPSTTRSKSYENTLKTAKKHKVTPPKGNKYPAPKISSKIYSAAELNTPPHTTEHDVKVKNLDQTPEQYPTSSHYYYSPHFLQTPMKSNQLTPFQSPAPQVPYQPSPQIYPPQTPHHQLSIPPQYSSPVIAQLPTVLSSPTTIISPPQLPQTPSVIIMNQNQLELRPLADGSGVFNTNTIMNQGFFLNGAYTLPQFQSVVVQVPTIDLLQNGLNFSFTQNLGTSESQSTVTVKNLTDDTKRQIKRKKFPNDLSRFDYLNKIGKPSASLIDESSTGFTDQQMKIFLQQLQMHTQILAVNYLQFYGNPFWWQLASKNKESLQELKELINSRHIDNCLELCEYWENDLKEDNESNKKYMEFLHEEMELDQSSFKEKKPFQGRFHNRVMERVLQSNAILYPWLLPHYPFRCIKFQKVSTLNSELTLIAIAYEHAYDELYKELNSFNIQRERKPQFQSTVSAIIRRIGTFRNEKSITKIILKHRLHKIAMNPIKFYFIHQRAPEVVHEIIDVSTAKPPTYLEKGVLPSIWEKYKWSSQRLQLHEKLKEPFTCADDSYLIDDDSSNSSIHQEENNSVSEIVLNESLKLQIINDINTPQIFISYVNQEDNLSPLKKSPQKVCQKSKEEKAKNLTSILKKVTGNCVEKSPKKKSVNFKLPFETPQKPQKILRGTLSNKFQTTLEKFYKEYSQHIKSSSHLIRLVFVRIRSIDIYWRLVDASRMLGSSKKNKIEGPNGHSSESVVKNRKQITSEEYSKRMNRKLADNRALIMQNARNENSTEKDCSYAHNYLEKVKKTLTESGDETLYLDFMKVLTSYNLEMESVPELYYKMETLLLPNYSDLLDLFLTFLLPEHASEIGKFCEHFLLTKMSELIQHLNLYFQKQPSHMKKIYSCLNELSTDPDLTIEKLKAKILPLLKGNQLLIEWFMGIFEAPSDNLDDYETLHLKKPLSEGEICDYTYEEMQSQDLIEGDSNNFSSCGVKYLNGKIMYRSKTLLPAKISFLVNEVDVEQKSPVASNKEENSSSWCVHEIRKHVQFSDKKKANENGDDNQDERTVKKKKSNKKFKVCDAQTLHAHAVRLNPPIHAQAGEKVSDVLQLLEINSHTVGTSQDSPKKQVCKSAKKSSNSPKKNVAKSPSTSSETSTNQSPSPSKSLPNNKKIRTITDNDSEDEQQNQVKKFKVDSSSEDSEVSLVNIEEIQVTSEAISVEEPEAWTRDEDKLILEEIRGGKCSKDESIDNLIKTLERRPRKEICERYEFLLNLLAKIASSGN